MPKKKIVKKKVPRGYGKGQRKIITKMTISDIEKTFGKVIALGR